MSLFNYLAYLAKLCTTVCAESPARRRSKNYLKTFVGRVLTLPARSVTTWVLLALIGLAVRTALSPSTSAPLGDAAAEPPAVSVAGVRTGVPADNTATGGSSATEDLQASAELEATPAGDVAPAVSDNASVADEDEAERLSREELLAGNGSAGGAADTSDTFNKQRARRNRPCKRDHTLRAVLASYCRVGAGDASLCCANDDGFCSSYLGTRCDSYEDNDCRIFDVLLKAHEFLLSKKALEQYTPDPRQSAFTSRGEYFRLVPCMQAQGYLNLFSCTGDEYFLKEALDRLEFLAVHLDEALTQTPYDGELGWAFLDAYRVTCDERYLEIGLKIAGSSEPNVSHVLNWGALEAMNLLRAHEVTGEESPLAEAMTIVDETLDYQNSDGSFPHQTHKGARSLPYTSWLARDLSLFAEHEVAPAELTEAVDRAAALLERQISTNGAPRYEGDSLVVKRIPDPVCVRCAKMGSAVCTDYCSEICSDDPELLPCSCITDPERDCPYVDVLVNITYYDDGASDYDVRGWTSELPATAAVLDRTGRLEAKWKVLDFLFGLQNSDGSFPDKWGYIPRPEDGMWLFASDEHSVIRTSSVFYYLSGMLRQPEVIGRAPHYLASGEEGEDKGKGEGVGRYENEGTDEDGASVDAVSAAAGNALPAQTVISGREPRVFVHPNPSFGAVSIDYDAEAAPSLVQILDVSGRLITELVPCANPDGDVLWNGLDATGRKVPPGVYFVKVTAGEESTCTKVILLGPDGVS